MADNINISPDMIENLVNILKNSNDRTDNTSNDTDNIPASSASNDSSSSNSNSGLDFDTIMKMKSIMDAFGNSDDSDAKLLYSLKPYLRESRQAKLDQYINILKISKVTKLFNNGKN